MTAIGTSKASPKARNIPRTKFKYSLNGVERTIANYFYDEINRLRQKAFAPVSAIEWMDVNHDNKNELIVAGNLFSVKPEIGRYDALHGLVLTSDGNGNFKSINSNLSGLSIKGEVRHLSKMKTAKGETLIFIRNNEAIKIFELN